MAKKELPSRESGRHAESTNPLAVREYFPKGPSPENVGLDTHQELQNVLPEWREHNPENVEHTTLAEQGGEEGRTTTNSMETVSNEAIAYNNLGDTLHKQGKYKEAEDAHRKAIQLSPGHALFYFYLVGTLLKQGKNKEAREAIRTMQAIPNTVYKNLVFYDNLGDAICSFPEGNAISSDSGAHI